MNQMRQIQAKNKRGSALVVILILVFIVIVILAVIITILVLSQSSKNPKADSTNNNTIFLYLEANDIQAKNSIVSNYLIISNNSQLSGQTTPNAYTYVGNVSDNGVQILCSADGYYSSLINKTFNNAETYNNLSKVDCYLNQVGVLTIRNTGELQINGESTITLNIQSQGIVQNLEACAAWTPGIIGFNPINSSVTNINIPGRFFNKVDSCYDLKVNSLNNSQINIPFNVTTNTLSPLDTLTFYIFDEDLYYNTTNNDFELASEVNGNNLGSRNDITYTINNPNA